MTADFHPATSTITCNTCTDHQGPLHSVNIIEGITIVYEHDDTVTVFTNPKTADDIDDENAMPLDRHTTLLRQGTPHSVMATESCTSRPPATSPPLCTCGSTRPPQPNVTALWFHHVPRALTDMDLTGASIDTWHRTTNGFEHTMFWNVLAQRVLTYPDTTGTVALELDVAIPPPNRFDFPINTQYSVGLFDYGPPPGFAGHAKPC